MDSELETFLRELLSKYKCFHYRTVYRSMYTVVFVFECEYCTVEIQVEYCDCNKIVSAGLMW